MNTQEKLEKLVRTMHSSGITREELEQDWHYRKGKTFADVGIAFAQGVKRGAGKLEYELMYAASDLDRVIYPRRQN